jgi:hypothetical protein
MEGGKVRRRGKGGEGRNFGLGAILLCLFLLRCSCSTGRTRLIRVILGLFFSFFWVY